MTVDEVLNQALQFSTEDRARVAERLLQSLDPPGEDLSEEEWQTAWAAEIIRRSDALARGEVETSESREVMDRVRQKMRERHSA